MTTTAPRFREMLAEFAPLLGSVPVYGPPVGLLLAPWLFLVLMLAAPFACLFAIVAAMAVAAALVAALAAVVVGTPYLLVVQLRRHRERHAAIRAPRAPRVTTRTAVRSRLVHSGPTP